MEKEINDKYEIVRFKDEKFELDVKVSPQADTVWLSVNDIANLFERDSKTIRKHLKNALEEELDTNSAVAKFATTATDGKVYQTEHYNFDAIISVGYRVHSKRGIQFRKRANTVLRHTCAYAHV